MRGSCRARCVGFELQPHGHFSTSIGSPSVGRSWSLRRGSPCGLRALQQLPGFAELRLQQQLPAARDFAEQQHFRPAAGLALPAQQEATSGPDCAQDRVSSSRSGIATSKLEPRQAVTYSSSTAADPGARRTPATATSARRSAVRNREPSIAGIDRIPNAPQTGYPCRSTTLLPYPFGKQRSIGDRANSRSREANLEIENLTRRLHRPG